MNSMHDSLARLRVRLVLGACLLGVAGGLVRWRHGPDSVQALPAALSGMAMVIFLGAAGGMLGMFARSLWMWSRKGDARGRETPDFADSLGLGSLAGAFAGLIVVLVFLDWSLAAWGAAVGAACGSAVATAFGDTVQVLLRMTVSDGKRGPFQDNSRDMDQDRYGDEEEDEP